MADVSKMTDKTHDILTELVNKAFSIQCISNVTTEERNKQVNAVITTVTEQIKQQERERGKCRDCGRRAVLCSTCVDRLMRIVRKVERERVEKLEGMLKKFAEIEISTKGHIYGLENAYDLLYEMRASARAALKELEAANE